MRALLLGSSRIGVKRVLPALAACRRVESIDVASRSHGAETTASLPKVRSFYPDYEEALQKSGADLVYVSLVNSAHAHWVQRSLERGLHVVVDKPAFLDLESAQQCAALAQRRSRCLAEAIVFTAHPQMQICLEVFRAAGSRPTRIGTTFSFPPMNEADFRYRRELGGGSLYDLGPYAAATSRLFFADPPDTVASEIVARQPGDGLDIAFSVLFTHADGRAMVGNFGFDTEYRNRIEVLGPGVALELDRVFTTPPDLDTTIKVRRSNREESVHVPCADAFARFLEQVFGAIDAGSVARFAESVVQDAELLSRLRRSSGER
jgi:predicted dehydrogenase